VSDSFETNGIITLQPGSSKVPYTFTFAAGTSAISNDGSIPYGSTISSAETKAFDASGNDVTTEIIDSETNTTLSVTPVLKYPSTSGEGNYSIQFLLTISTGAIMEVDFTRIYAKDISA